jgi:peroxiredoxin
MTIKVGDTVPPATFTTFGPDGPGPLTTDQLTKGKKVAIFAVPGAFTPTCSARSSTARASAWARAPSATR